LEEDMLTNLTDGQALMLMVFLAGIVVALLNGCYKWYRNERMRKNPSYGARRVRTTERPADKPYVITNVRHRPRVR